jgi:O-antigen ligase
LKYEFSGNLDPNGHSILQRLEFWKASKYIIKENWIFGVGLGSSKATFLQTYKKMNSKLLIENQWESHNQFLSIWVSYGIIGLVLFLLWLFSIFQNIVHTHWVNLSIFFVVLFSFLVEDTLSTLTGMTLFGFFAGIFQNKISLNQDR